MNSSINKNNLVNDLKIFIDEHKTWLRNTLDSVGWDISHLENCSQIDEPDFVPCSINSEHRIPRENLLNHENRCERKNADYPKINDIPNLEVTLGYAVEIYFHGLIQIIFIDLKDAIRSVSDCDDGSSDNLDTNKTVKNKSEDGGNFSTCLVELLAAERDAKRRRAAHRGKRVHSNKKSYVEVLREVISSQMETLNDDSKIETKSVTIEENASQKTIIQPRVDSYLGVGNKIFSGNPFKRWMAIEEEEQKLFKKMETGRKEKYLEYNRRREDTNEKYKKYEKSSYDYDDDYRKLYHKHRESYYDRHRDISKSADDRKLDINDKKAYFSSYDDEKNTRSNPDRDRLKKRHRDDSHSDSYEASNKHKKTKKYKKKKRKKKSCERTDDSHDSSDRHKKKRKKKSHERSVHTKKNSKSKHRDSEDEQNRAKS